MNLLSSAWKAVEANPLRTSPSQPTPSVVVAACADSSHPTAPLPDSSAQSAYDAMMYPYQSSSQHMPLNFFIHEVLRRSRTNFVTLQTSLCYLEVVAAKLPSLVKEEAELLLARQAQNEVDGQRLYKLILTTSILLTSLHCRHQRDARGTTYAVASFVPSSHLPRRTSPRQQVLAGSILLEQGMGQAHRSPGTGGWSL